MFEPLLLDAASESLWLDFQSKRRLPAAGPRVLDRWRRSRRLGASHEGPRPEDALERGHALEGRRERLGEVLATGRGVLDRMASAAAQEHYQLLLSDPEGVVVWSAGGGDFAATARAVKLMAGASWSETVRGTNAIGTAIAEARPVFVEGAAHFARAYHDLVCYAAPVLDPRGEVVAVLDATSRVQRADSAVGIGVVGAARALEELLRVRAFSRAGATVTRALARSLERMDCPVAVLEPPGRVVRFNRPARQLFPQGARMEAEALVGVDFETLARHALASPDAALPVASPASGTSHDLRLEPIESDGRLIALIAFFEVPSRRRVTPRPPAPAAPRSVPAFGEVFAEDPATGKALAWAGRIARSDIPVMLLAETGSGKELVARGLHDASHRASGPFVAVNCGSVAPTLLESELFGYGPGAFTGASERGRNGYLQAASGGTLFLDEVAEMPLAMQASLLRVLESGTYQRVGETKTRRADLRLLCATCRDLPQLVAEGTFRQDLYYRLKGATVTLPPLRDRTDVAALARHLLRHLVPDGAPTPELSPEVARFFEHYPWPGNVRELKSTLEVALVLAQGDPAIELEHLPPDLPTEDTPEAAPAPTPLADAQQQAVRKALSEVAGNVSQAAKRLGVARSTLYRMMRRYGIRRSK